MRTPTPVSIGSTATSLIRRAKLADPRAWDRLAQLYGPLVYAWGRQAGLQPHDAADVLQEVFASLGTHLSQFRKQQPGDSFRAWIRTICMNKIRDHWRRSPRQVRGTGGTDAFRRIAQTVDPASLSLEANEPKELDALRRRALTILSGDIESRTWLAFWRAAVEGDAPADIAADLQMSTWAVYKAKARVLHRLREEFADLIE